MKVILLLNLFLQKTNNQTTNKTEYFQTPYFKCNSSFPPSPRFQAKISHTPKTAVFGKVDHPFTGLAMTCG